MATSELFPGESGVRQQVIEAGWSETIGNGWALVFEGPENENLTLRAYPSFFLEGVTPAYLIVETLEGDPQRGPLGFNAYDEYRIEISYMKKSGLGRS